MRVPSKSGRSSGRGDRRVSFSRETNLGRRNAVREERRTVLILTNGQRTEVDYFEALKTESWVAADKVTVKFLRGDPNEVVNRAAAIRDDSTYSEAWAVCDLDEFDVTAAYASADDHDVALALSVPCFEVWLLLHVTEKCPGFNSATQVSDYLEKHVRGWGKTKLNFTDFQAGVSAAVTRAQRLGKPPEANPSTAVWQVIESLRGDKIPQ
jgi:RloB-like protein